jgi:hypothetical protein
MSALNRRNVILAFAALAAVRTPSAAAQQAAPLDLTAGFAIGRAYIDANPTTDLEALRRTLLPGSFNEAARERLRASVANDFRAGRIFKHQGWMLSVTEAQVFALLAVT